MCRDVCVSQMMKIIKGVTWILCQSTHDDMESVQTWHFSLHMNVMSMFPWRAADPADIFCLQISADVSGEKILRPLCLFTQPPTFWNVMRRETQKVCETLNPDDKLHERSRERKDLRCSIEKYFIWNLRDIDEVQSLSLSCLIWSDLCFMEWLKQLNCDFTLNKSLKMNLCHEFIRRTLCHTHLFSSTEYQFNQVQLISKQRCCKTRKWCENFSQSKETVKTVLRQGLDSGLALWLNEPRLTRNLLLVCLLGQTWSDMSDQVVF